MASAHQILTTGPTGMSVTGPQMAAGALHGLDDVWLLLVALEQAWRLYYGEPPDYPFKSQLDSVKLRLICLCLAVETDIPKYLSLKTTPWLVSSTGSESSESVSESESDSCEVLDHGKHSQRCCKNSNWSAGYLPDPADWA